MNDAFKVSLNNYCVISFCRGFQILWETFQYCPWDKSMAIIQIEGTPKTAYRKFNLIVLKRTRWRLEIDLKTAKINRWYGVNFGTIVEKKAPQ